MLSSLSALSVRAAAAAVAIACIGTALSATLAGTAAELPLRTGAPLVAVVVVLAGACLSFDESPRATALALIALPLAAFALVPLAWWVVQARPNLLWVLYAAGAVAGLTAMLGGARTLKTQAA